MLIGALGCNLAWGIIDALLYLMGCLSEQGRSLARCEPCAKRRPRRTPSKSLRMRCRRWWPRPSPPRSMSPCAGSCLSCPSRRRTPPAQERLAGGFGGVLVGVPLHLPGDDPFIFMNDLGRAMRVSNAIAVALLFLTGYAFGRVAEHRPWLTGLVMVVLGAALVALTMALGDKARTPSLGLLSRLRSGRFWHKPPALIRTPSASCSCSGGLA